MMKLTGGDFVKIQDVDLTVTQQTEREQSGIMMPKYCTLS